MERTSTFKELTEIQRGERVGALPFLLMRGDFDVVHDQWYPAAEHEHAMPNDGG